MTIRSTLLIVLGVALLSSPALAGSEYLVLLDPGEDAAYRPAAEALATLRSGTIVEFDPADLAGALSLLKEAPPRFVAFVLPPAKIDVDLCHSILTMATKVDDDPFIDFEYGFITGRDGAAALRFVQRIEAASKRKLERNGAMFGTWEGMFLPPMKSLPALEMLGLTFTAKFVMAKATEESRKNAARAALRSFATKDLLLFFSHGYPDRMVGCFTAQDLRDWEVKFAPGVLVNCSCWNGAPGRWFNIGRGGRFTDSGVIGKDQSVALQILDSGISAYIAGVDPWHGPLANQVFQYLVDDGLRLGGATKAMHDRLALAFLPERIAYPGTATVVMTGEGRENRRRNGAGMILYGDPASAPFTEDAPTRFFAKWDESESKLTLGCQPLLTGHPGVDFMLPQARLMDYYSVRTPNFSEELKMEVYRVVPLPEGMAEAPSLRVVGATSNGKAVKTGTPQVVIEETPAGRRLHVRVPIDEKVFPPKWMIGLATHGVKIELEVAR